MKRTLHWLAISGLITLSPLASADTVLGLYLGVGKWEPDIEGSARETGTNTYLDLDDTFGSLSEDADFIYAALEHPIPIIPNIMLQQVDMSVDDTGTMVATVEFDGDTFTVGTDVDTVLDFSHTDATLYYEVLDNWLNLDFGLTLLMFDGELSLTEVATPTNTASEDLDQTIPMLYLKGRIDLPLTGFYVSAAGNVISYDGQSLTDYSLAAGYQTDGWVMDIGLELGIRTFTLELDDLDDLDADFEFSGTYAAALVHF